MPASDTTINPPDDAYIAIMAETLYLLNLLLLPGLAFLALLVLAVKNLNQCGPLCRCHLRQTVRASIWAGVLIVVVNAVIILFGGYTQPWTWVLLIIYFTVIHSTLVLLGVVALAKALASKHFHYPLIGVPCTQVGD